MYCWVLNGVLLLFLLVLLVSLEFLRVGLERVCLLFV